jgi:glycosyltransferase involved in cell wall biosynthesis
LHTPDTQERTSLRVLFVVRPNEAERPGGDTKLARDTLTAVKELGVVADCVAAQEPDARGYDIAHVFNVGQPEVCRRQLDACAASDVPVALSPIWLDLREFLGKGFAYERLFSSARTESAVENTLARYRKRSIDSFLNRRQRRDYNRRLAAQREILERAAVLLPNSAIEARDYLVALGVRDKPLVTVHIPADVDPERCWQEDRQGVVALGRVETRKNQTALTYALRNEAMSIDIIGAMYDPGLAAACKKWCPRARFHDRLPRATVLQMLGRAEVHALVSWCETAGIASMEAAAAGAKIVVSDRGAEVEYFGDDAEYADPADPDSIRAAVQRAFARPWRRRDDSLARRIRKLSWRAAALETVRAYQMALG